MESVFIRACNLKSVIVEHDPDDDMWYIKYVSRGCGTKRDCIGRKSASIALAAATKNICLNDGGAQVILEE